MIARKFRFALIPAVLLGMVACNLNDQAHTPEKPASPAEPSEATVAVDTSLEGVDIDTATMNALMRESEALGDAGLAEEELDSATLDSLIRESGTSDSAIESQALDAAMGPIAAKTSAASKPCRYGHFKWAGGTCTDPYPVWKKKGTYVSPRIGQEHLDGVRSLRIESRCKDGVIRKFGLHLITFRGTPQEVPFHLGRTHVSSIVHSCGTVGPLYAHGHRLPKVSPKPPERHDLRIRYWEGLLVGLRARSGRYIDALGPIMYKNGRLSSDIYGKLNGGTRKSMLCPRNYYVAGFIGYRSMYIDMGLTGLRMVCKEFPGLPAPQRRTLVENGMPFRPATVIAATFLMHAKHVYDKHILQAPGNPSKFNEALMGSGWYKTKDPNKVPMALYNLFMSRAISYKWERVIEKNIWKWKVWVETPNVIGYVFGEYGTTWTKFIFHKTETGTPVMESAYPDWGPPTFYDEL